jgi:uncharacterized membrane-anchored protein
MLPVRLRYLRLLAGLGVLLASSCLSVRGVEARDGRSRTPSAAIEDLPGPSSFAQRSVIVDIAPLQLLDRRGPTTAAASPTASDHHEVNPKIADSIQGSTRFFEAVVGGKESIEGAFAVPGPVIAPPSPPREQVDPPGEPSEEVTRELPASSENRSVAPVLAASRGWLDPVTIDSASSGRLSLDLDVKPTLTLTDAGSSSPRDGAIRPTDSQFMGPWAPKPPTAEVAEARAPGPPAPREFSTEAGAGSGGAIASALPPIAPRGEIRGGKRPPALSAFARDVQRASNVIPPMQLPKSADRKESSPVSGGEQTWESGRTGFQMPSAWLSQTAPLPTAAPASIPAAESETKTGDPSTEGDDQLARKAEQQQKSRLWQRLVKAQPASTSKAAEEQELNSASRFNLLRLIKRLMRDETETAEARAYASLLEEGVRGPTRVRIADRATLWLPFGYVFLDAEKARDLMEGEEGVLDDANFGVILPAKRTPTWMAYVDVIDQGHIKEDDANALEPTVLLAGLTKASAAQNVERGRSGLVPLSVSEWVAAPKYAPSKHILNSCVSAVDGAGSDPQARLVNCASLALGRRGAIKVLVTGALYNLLSFQGEAATLAEKIAYDPAAGYEGYVPEEDESAGYGVAGLAGGIIGLKEIAAPVAAAGAGKAQTLLLYTFLSYWEAILVVLVAAVLGVYWFLGNQAEEEEEIGASRHAARMPLRKAASWAARSGLQSLFERKASPTRVVETHSSAEGNQPNSAQAPARSKVGFAAWQKKFVSVLWLNNPRGPSSGELAAEPVHAPEPKSRRGKSSSRDGEQATADPGDITTSISVLRRLQRGQDVAPSHDQGDPLGAKSEMVTKSAKNLNRLASLMRKKTEDSIPSADVSRLPRSRSVPAPRLPASDANVKEEKSAEGMSPSFDLVEPGDAEAVSMAVTAHEAVQQAHG